MNAERNRICEEPVRISEKTEKKVSKKRTKSYLYENENVDGLKILTFFEFF